VKEEEEMGYGMKEGQRLNVMRAEKGQQYRRQNGRRGDLLTGNTGAMKSIHVETAGLLEHTVTVAVTSNLSAFLLFGAV
jgi:hypothetical protein